MPAKSKITRERYEARIETALDYIHQNLREPLDLETVARESSFSPYHFHRIFHAMVGETINEYIRRKRLEYAVAMLVCGEVASITEIALSCGFSSSSNFSKAFSAYFGCSPVQVKNPEKFKQNGKIGELKRKYGKDFDPRKLYPEIIPQTKERDMNDIDVNIVERPAKRICFLTSPGGYDEKQAFETWDRVSKWALDSKVPHGDYIGICHGNPIVTPSEKCRYDAAVTVSEDTVINKPFEEGVIPGGKYAIAYYCGPEDPDAKLHLKIYRDWFPQSGFEPDDHPLMERYLNDSREDGYVEMQILIKIKE